MKPRTATLASLALAAFAGNHFVNATKHSSEVTYEDVTFNIAYFDDGRKRPYRVRFKEDVVVHRFFFKRRNILVKLIKSGTEKYRVFHRSRSPIRVDRRDSGARMLLDDVEDEENEDEETPLGAWGPHQRRLYACEDCEATWQTLCETSALQGGVGSVCELVDFYDDPIAELGQEGIDIMCDKFIGACDFFSPADACAGQCEGDTPGETVKCWKRQTEGNDGHVISQHFELHASSCSIYYTLATSWCISIAEKRNLQGNPLSVLDRDAKQIDPFRGDIHVLHFRSIP